MAEKSLFYNAFPDANSATGYDRNYNGDDLSDWFSIVCDTGVLKGGLAVSAGTGLSVSVAIGKATIRGKGYINNTALTLNLATAPTGSSPRYDMIVLRMDNTQTQSARRTYLAAKTGTSSIPTVSNLTRTADVFELLLAVVAVQPNATSIAQSNITDKRGDATLCPWFTAVKGYDDYYDAIVEQFESNGTMASAGRSFVTNIATSLYNNKYSIIDVYTNGLHEEDTAYSVSTSGSYITITFTANKAAGAKICVVLSNYIDGEGMSTALSQYTALVQDVADLKAVNENIYVCNGIDDNVQITNICRTFLNGGTDYSSMRLKIVGTFGYTAMAYGDGSSANPFRFFNLSGDFNRRVTLDFTNCSFIQITPQSGKYTVIFATQNLIVVGANIQAGNTAENTTIKFFSASTGEIRCESCRFWVNSYSGGNIAACGTFENCRGSVLNVSGNSYCFQPSENSLLRVIGGEYYAYTGGSSNASAVIGQSGTYAVSILYGVNAPTLARSGYYQKNSIWQVGNAGWVNCTDLVSELPLNVVSGKSNIRGTIALSKGGQM